MLYKVKVIVKVKDRKFAPKVFDFWVDAADWIAKLAELYCEELLKVNMEIVFGT